LWQTMWTHLQMRSFSRHQPLARGSNQEWVLPQHLFQLLVLMEATTLPRCVLLHIGGRLRYGSNLSGCLLPLGKHIHGSQVVRHLLSLTTLLGQVRSVRMMAIV